MNDKLREQLDTWWSDWNARAMPIRPAEKLLATIQAHTDKAVKEARIDELENLAKKQQVFEGYGFDETGVDINDIDDRIKELQEGKE